MLANKKKFIFLLSHPIQYFSPLFQQMAKDKDIDVLVLYCSDENINGHIDRDFRVEVKWDIPLLEGYNYRFLKNNAWKPSIFNGFFGLINFEIFNVLKNERGSYLVIHGWNYFTQAITIIYGKLSGMKVCIRGDNPYNQEMLKSKKLLFIKRILLGKILFKFIDYFLYVGMQNRKFYEFYGIKESKLIFTPHAVDNDRYKSDAEKYKDRKQELRKELGLPVDKIIILTSGKYIYKKRPMTLLRAYQLLNNEKTVLIFLGEGVLRKQMEEYISSNNLRDVYLAGFKNQSEIGKYLAVSDIFILPSGEGETWGLVVNEAMNFGLPIIVSDLVGCGDDLIQNGKNGYIYVTDDTKDMANNLMKLIANEEKRKLYGIKSKKIIDFYSYDKIIKNMKENLL